MGAPGATKTHQRAPREGQRAPQEGFGWCKIEPKAVLEAKKVNFVQSAPRSAPADARNTSDTPPIGPQLVQKPPKSLKMSPESRQGGPKEVQDAGSTAQRTPRTSLWTTQRICRAAIIQDLVVGTWLKPNQDALAT